MMLRVWLVAGALVVALLAGVAPPPAHAAERPAEDPFYSYSGALPLTDIAPGSVLKTRPAGLHLSGLPLPVPSTQVLYRTTDELGRPSTTVATVIKPLVRVFDNPRLVSFQYAYDSLSDRCSPSYVLDGAGPDSTVNNPQFPIEESAMIALLLEGYTIVTADYEGTGLHWVAGRESGRGVLDGARSAINLLPELTRQTPVGMIGYSGGGLATQWASQLAPRYAPDLKIVGAASGAFPVHLAHNYEYADGSLMWSSILPAVVTGISRAYEIPVHRYLNDKGRAVFERISDQCIGEFFGRTPGLRFASLLKARYSSLFDIPSAVGPTNNLIMGRRGTPDSPLFFAVGNLDGTGDGVMVAADMRTLARKYCNRGLPVQYAELTGLDHFGAAVPYYATAELWLIDRFNNMPAPSSCGSIRPGNRLDPVPLPVRRQHARVMAVRNADTIVVRMSTGQRRVVRLVGADAPAAGCGSAAAERLTRRLLPHGARVALRSDEWRPYRTRTGKLARYVERSGVDVGRRLVRRGWAQVESRRFARQPGYRAAQSRAQAADLGLWERC